MLEVEYLAPLQLDAKRIFDQAQANLLKDADKEQFSRMRTAEAIVFFQPRPELPDLLLAGTSEPLSGYFARWVKDSGGDPGGSQIPNLSSNFQGYISDHSAIPQVLTPQLGELLQLRPDVLIQILGGFVVVVPRSWASATPMETANAAFEIQLDLDFACAVYNALSVSQSTPSEAVAAT